MIPLAIIPARGGSKRLPGKNLLPLGTVPLIAWTIAAARASGMFERIVVSTDHRDIAEVARQHGAQTPFLRPEQYAADRSSSDEMLSHALGALGASGPFALLQPTSPFRDGAAIRDAAALYQRSGARMVVSVTAAKPLAWLMAMDEQARLSPVLADAAAPAASPVLPNGAIYLTDCATFAEGSCLPRTGRVGFAMGAIDSLDIDTADDFALAEAVVAAGLRGIG